uniref:Geranylgeranyl transferase type-1 subunit beta n=1 Tax=Panagrolaimus davidi TaxID=227884 RepID=A0A914QG95_9BILA
MNKLITWGIQQQDLGFHGRTNKCDDTCYAFWLGATLAMLNSENLVDTVKLREFLVECEDTRLGGFCKYTDSESSDVLHTYFGIAALSIFNEPTIRPIFAALNISCRAVEHLERTKIGWRQKNL